MSSTLSFTQTIEITGINPYVRVSAERATSLKPKWRRPMPVLVRLNGGPRTRWRTNMMPTGDGDFLLYLHGAMRTASGTSVGDVVNVELSFDAEYRGGPTHDVPEWLRSELDHDAVAMANWIALSPSRQKEVLRYVSTLRSADAKQRNAVQVMRVLRGEPARYMGRDWVDGR
jgi:hypothetical protein